MAAPPPLKRTRVDEELEAWVRETEADEKAMENTHDKARGFRACANVHLEYVEAVTGKDPVAVYIHKAIFDVEHGAFVDVKEGTAKEWGKDNPPKSKGTQWENRQSWKLPLGWLEFEPLLTWEDLEKCFRRLLQLVDDLDPENSEHAEFYELANKLGCQLGELCEPLSVALSRPREVSKHQRDTLRALSKAVKAVDGVFDHMKIKGTPQKYKGYGGRYDPTEPSYSPTSPPYSPPYSPNYVSTSSSKVPRGIPVTDSESSEEEVDVVNE